MLGLDRHVWAGSMTGTAFGVHVGIRVDHEELLPRVQEALPPGWRPVRRKVVDRLYSLGLGGVDPNTRGLRRRHWSYADWTLLARSFDDLPSVLGAFESDLQLFVAEHARDRVFVHAGVVGWRGRALLVPGRSFSGKTTLIEALVRAGASYLSDEFAVLDAEGRVHPFARRLSVRQDGGGVRRLDPAALGAIATRPLPAGLVVLTRFREGARFRPRTLPPGRAVLELFRHTVPAH